MSATSPHSGWTFGQQSLSSEGSDLGVSFQERTEDPFTRFYRAPIARLLVRGLERTKITPDHISLFTPLLAVFSGYFLTFNDARNIFIAAMLFEAGSMLACIASTLARSRNMETDGAHTYDATASVLSKYFLVAGIVWHFHLHAPPSSALTRILTVPLVLVLAMAQGAIRSFAADYYRRKLAWLFEQGLDAMAREQATPLARFIALLWGVSNGEAFISLVVGMMLVGELWAGLLFFASIGVLWLAGAVLVSEWFLHRASRRWAVA